MVAPDDSLTAATSHPWNALLARSQPARQRLDVILSDPSAATLVPRLPVEDFYYLVKDVGLDDAGELLGLASAEQFRTCVDFDIWERDQVVSSRLLSWLRIVVSELLPAGFVRAVHALDLEVLALLLARHCRVYDRSLGEEPEEGSATPRYSTPDTFFIIEIDADRDSTLVIEQLLDRLHAVDAELARRLILEAKWGLVSELEETSYRLRSGRMADLGFIEHYEALEVYRYLDPNTAANVGPARWRAAGPVEATVLPALFASSFRSESFLTRVLDGIGEARLIEQLGSALLAMLNRVLAADRIDPADIDAVQDTVQRAHDTLSLGLEHLADDHVARGSALLERMPLLQIFRVGYSLTVDLAQRAKQLRQGGSDDANLDPLLEPRPLYPRALDSPPLGGARPFRTVEDVRKVAGYLSRHSARSRQEN